MNANTYTAFDGEKLLIHGPLDEVVLKIKKKLGKENQRASIVIFSDATGRTMDFNFQGNDEDIRRRLEVFTTADEGVKASSGPGRPKLGVISREVSLLPRHWEWLANQTEGSSAMLRNLVEGAMKKSSGVSEVKAAQERTYKFMNVMAGDRPNYEEALRALYRKDAKSFGELIADWPEDVVFHLGKLAKPAFAKP